MSTMQQVNLSDFDFNQPLGFRSSRLSISDAIVSFRVKGRGRKSDTYEINLSAFVKKITKDHPKRDLPKIMNVGGSKVKKGGKCIVVFDNPKLPGGAAISNARGMDLNIVNSKGLVTKMFDVFDLEIPNIAGTITRMFFNLETIIGQPNVYLVVPVRVEKVSATGEVSSTDYTEKREEEVRPKNHHRF